MSREINIPEEANLGYYEQHGGERRKLSETDYAYFSKYSRDYRIMCRPAYRGYLSSPDQQSWFDTPEISEDEATPNVEGTLRPRNSREGYGSTANCRSWLFLLLMLIVLLLLSLCIAYYSGDRSPPDDRTSHENEPRGALRIGNSRLSLESTPTLFVEPSSTNNVVDPLTIIEGVQRRIAKLEEQLTKIVSLVESLKVEIQTSIVEVRNRIEQLEEKLTRIEKTEKVEVRDETEEVQNRMDNLEEQVKRIETLVKTEKVEIVKSVHRLLEKYHADRTGKPDYALGSNGGEILSIRRTRPFIRRSSEYVLGCPFPWEHTNTPDIILKPGYMPGECWAFEGANGRVVVQLLMRIFVSGFSLEHTPKALTPMGHIQSAPRKFSVWGLWSLESEEEEFLGRFEFEDNGQSLQTFDAIETEEPFHLVELRVESNHGHPEYTCVYRFRVHGRPAV